MVNFDLPYTLSGVSEQHYYGTGLIIDAKKGFILVDRNTVPIAMGDVRITFAGSLEIDGQVEYIHPLHNLAVVSYDPSLIGNTPVKTASFNTKPLYLYLELSVFVRQMWMVLISLMGLKTLMELSLVKMEVSALYGQVLVFIPMGK